MFKVLLLNKISKKGLKQVSKDQFEFSTDCKDPDAILVRSADLHDYDIPRSVKFIGRAGAGVNNIPIEECSKRGIVVCNTPGANANAVKELVLVGLLLSSRRIMSGIEWVKSLNGSDNVEELVEAEKSEYTGPELKGKRIGVIGLGKIGILVANMAIALGMKVYGFDTSLSVDNALGLSNQVNIAKSVEKLMEKCDYVTLHIPYLDSTKNFVNEELLSHSKPGQKILNFARGGLVDNEAMIKALKDGRISRYITDFPSEDLIGLKNVVAIPHLGASTPESEINCARMVVNECREYLELGNIFNSVNYPDIDDGLIETTGRITINHRNIPNMIAQVTKILGKNNINIANLSNLNRGEYAYTVINTDSPVGLDIKEDLYKIDGVTRVRILK